MGGGLAFLLKKTWHPARQQNQEEKWKREHKLAEETRKGDELRKQLEEERKNEDMMKMAEEAGYKREVRLDWMYQGGMAAKEDAAKRQEEHLLGIKPATFSQPAAEESRAERLAALPSVHANVVPASQNETWQRLNNDPLFMIKRQEQEQLKAIKQNPIKMQQILAEVARAKAAKEAKKAAKKERKEKKKADNNRQQGAGNVSGVGSSDSDGAVAQRQAAGRRSLVPPGPGRQLPPSAAGSDPHGAPAQVGRHQGEHRPHHTAMAGSTYGRQHQDQRRDYDHSRHHGLEERMAVHKRPRPPSPTAADRHIRPNGHRHGRQVSRSPPPSRQRADDSGYRSLPHAADRRCDGRGAGSGNVSRESGGRAAGGGASSQNGTRHTAAATGSRHRQHDSHDHPQDADGHDSIRADSLKGRRGDRGRTDYWDDDDKTLGGDCGEGPEALLKMREARLLGRAAEQPSLPAGDTTQKAQRPDHDDNNHPGNRYGLSHNITAPDAVRGAAAAEQRAAATRSRLAESAAAHEAEVKLKALQRHRRTEYKTGRMTEEDRQQRLAEMAGNALDHDEARAQRLAAAKAAAVAADGSDQIVNGAGSGNGDKDAFVKAATKEVFGAMAKANTSLESRVASRKHFQQR